MVTACVARNARRAHVARNARRAHDAPRRSIRQERAQVTKLRNNINMLREIGFVLQIRCAGAGAAGRGGDPCPFRRGGTRAGAARHGEPKGDRACTRSSMLFNETNGLCEIGFVLQFPPFGIAPSIRSARRGGGSCRAGRTRRFGPRAADRPGPGPGRIEAGVPGPGLRPTGEHPLVHPAAARLLLHRMARPWPRRRAPCTAPWSG